MIMWCRSCKTFFTPRLFELHNQCPKCKSPYVRLADEQEIQQLADEYRTQYETKLEAEK